MSNKPDRQRGIKYNRMGHVGRIREYMLDKRGAIELSDKEAETWERLQKAMSLRIHGYTSNQAARQIAKDCGVSESQAQRDVQNCISLYGDITKVEKQGHRHVASEMALKAFRYAIRNEDPKAMTAAAALYAKVHGVDKEDNQEFDYSKLQQHVYPTIMDEVSKQAMKLILETRGPIDFSKAYDLVADDVESEDVTPAHE